MKIISVNTYYTRFKNLADARYEHMDESVILISQLHIQKEQMDLLIEKCRKMHPLGPSSVADI
jgi:hypothetical protein